jgi:hypothetical protein
MAKYKATFPFVDDMGNVPSVVVEDKYTETKEEEALWHLNKCREHDGLRPRKHLPRGTKFVRVSDG